MTTLASAAGWSVAAGVVAVYTFIGVSSDNAALRGGGCPRGSTTECREGRGVASLWRLYCCEVSLALTLERSPYWRCLSAQPAHRI